jgi:hypothetical protein
MITVLYRLNPQAYFHAFFPLLTSKFASQITFTEDLNFCLNKDKNRVIAVIGIFKGNYDQVAYNVLLLQKLKQKYEKLVFLDDSDGADSLHVELIDFVDLYYKKQLLKDRQQYLNSSYGRQCFSDYYYSRFQVIDENPNIREPLVDKNGLTKLRLFWNIGAAVYPKKKLNRKIAYALAASPFHWLRNPFYPLAENKTIMVENRENAIQARFGYAAYTSSLGFQRKLMLEKIANQPNIRTGRINQASYNIEIRSIMAVLSPFGWGEICHRDFEAFYYSTLLLKPDCSHIETWPDVFIPEETYVPISWDMEDLIEKLGKVMSNKQQSAQIAAYGQSVYSTELTEMPIRVESFIQELLS